MKDSVQSDISAFITSVITSAASFGFNLPSDVVTTISSLAPSLERCIYRALSFLSPKRLSEIECARLGLCYSEIAKAVKQNYSSGLQVCMPELLEQKAGYSCVDEVIEALFRTALNDSQTIKSKIYGSFIGNVAFQFKYDSTQVYHLLRIVAGLSYYELCLVSALSQFSEKNYYLIEQEASSDNADNPEVAELFVALLHIMNLGLLRRVKPFYLGRTLDSHELSFLARDLCRLFDLKLLKKEDVEKIQGLVQKYVREVERF